MNIEIDDIVKVNGTGDIDYYSNKPVCIDVKFEIKECNLVY